MSGFLGLFPRLILFLPAMAAASPLAAEDVSPRLSMLVALAAECGNIHPLGEAHKKLRIQLEAFAIGDTAARCPIYKQMIDIDNKMISIFESDPERCGVRDNIIDNLKNATRRLGKTTAGACGNEI